MKHIKLYESYLTEKYVTYDKMGNWGSPSDIEEDLRMTIINLLKYGGISDNLGDVQYVDQSSDKGIKWQIEVKGKGSDIIHAYKDGKFRGQYEWYLNKKRSSAYDIQQYFLNKYVSDLNKYIASMNSFDVNYQYADGKAYNRGSEHSKRLVNLYNALSNSDKKKAYDAFVKKHRNVDRNFKAFRGS